MTRVEIVIDELIVRGLTPEAARAAAATLESRLALIATAGPDVAPRDEPFRRLPPVEASSADTLGDAVADEVWGALAPGGSP